jgi:hypothetical protein
MAQNDMAQWARSTKLAAVAGPMALCLFGGAFFLSGGLRLFVWGLAAGLIFSAAEALVNDYMRRGPLDTSRAAIDAKARRVRALTIAGIAVGSFVAFTVSHVGGFSAPVMGFFVGVFAYMALRLSPLSAPRITTRSPVSPLSRMTSMERAARRNYEYE